MEKINVSKEKCIGCGACVAIDPEHFEFDDDGKSECISNEALDSENLTNAIESCPTSAIEKIDEESMECDNPKCHCDDCTCEECDCDDEECDNPNCHCEDCNCEECDCDDECDCEECNSNHHENEDN